MCLGEKGVDSIGEQNLADEIDEAQKNLESNQKYLQAQKLLVTLPVKYQEVIALRFAENKKLSEIASILNKKEGTVKSLLSRGLRLLREQMDEPLVQPSGHKRIEMKSSVKAVTTDEVRGVL